MTVQCCNGSILTLVKSPVNSLSSVPSNTGEHTVYDGKNTCAHNSHIWLQTLVADGYQHVQKLTVHKINAQTCTVGVNKKLKYSTYGTGVPYRSSKCSTGVLQVQSNYGSVRYSSHKPLQCVPIMGGRAWQALKHSVWRLCVEATCSSFEREQS